MALSNWAGAAWNEKGEPVIPRTNRIELYKYYLIIDNCLDVYSGEILYKELYIVAKQLDDPEGIFFYIHDTKNEKIIMGIGMYGYNKNDEWVGIPKETFTGFLDWLKTIKNSPRLYYEPPKITKHWYYNQGSLYILENTLSKQLNEHLEEILSDPELSKMLMNPLL